MIKAINVIANRQSLVFCKALLWAVPLLFCFYGVSHAGDAATGQLIAQKWCASCHLVGRSGRAIDAAPSFHMIANNPKYTEARLRGWLYDPHPPMPNLDLTKRQVDDIITYIGSLKQKP